MHDMGHRRCDDAEQSFHACTATFDSLCAFGKGHIKHVNIASSHGIEAWLVFVTMLPSPYCHHMSITVLTSVNVNYNPLARQNSSPIPDQGPSGWLSSDMLQSSLM